MSYYFRPSVAESNQNWPTPDVVQPERRAPLEEKPQGTIKSHINGAYLHELSGSESDSDSLDSLNYENGSQLSSSDESDPEWTEGIGSKGDLFYVQPVSTEAVQASSDHGSYTNRSFNITGKLPKVKPNSNENILGQINFLPFHKGDIIEIVLDLELPKHGRRVTHCEALLGVIPGEEETDSFTSPTSGGSSTSNLRHVVVRGLTPNGAAMKSQLIKIGDRLLKIEDRDVTTDNLPRLLSCIIPPKKVKVLIERPYDKMENEPVFHAVEQEKNFLLQLVKPNHDQYRSAGCSSNLLKPHLITYLHPSTEASASPMDGILYQFPHQQSILSSLSGLFMTLSHMIGEVTNSAAQSSTLLVDNHLVHAAYILENQDVLVFAVPSEWHSLLETCQIFSNVTRLLKWQYQTLSRAFNEENKQSLDSFFEILFESSLEHGFVAYRVFGECLQGIHWYPLTSDLQAQVDTLLTELESGDFGDMSEAFYETKRLYVILGSCFFYKGVLCTSHLPKEDTMDVHLLASYFRLLKLTSQGQLAQVIVWREVFPTRGRSSLLIENNTQFKEQDGRTFVLMVALKHSLLCILVEAGGCTARAGNHPPPDPFYVDQARAVLLKMNSSDLTAQIERCYDSTRLPEVQSADAVVLKSKETKKPPLSSPTKPLLSLSRSSSRQALNWKETLGPRSLSHASLLSTGKKRSETLFSSPKRSFGDGERQQLLSSNSPPDLEIEGDQARTRIDSSLGQPSVSSSSDADSRTSSEDIYRGLKSRRILSGSFDLSSLHTDLDDIENERNASYTRLLTGCGNALFHYVSVNVSEGILVAPLEGQSSGLGSMHSQILNSFRKCATNIHSIFKATHRSKDLLCRNSETAKFSSDRSLAPVKEQGVLFHVTPVPPLRPTGNINFKKSAPMLAFWVVGRVFLVPEPREVYVCFQDSTPQNAVELAFKLSFGTVF